MLTSLKKQWDDIHGVFLYVLLALAVSLQVLILVATVFSFIPIKLDSSLDNVLPQVLALFRPEREMAFYQFFIILTIAVQIAVIAIFRDRLNDQAFLKKLGEFLVAEYVWIGLLLFAVFKVLIYKEPFWAKAMFFVFFTLSIASKVFWPEVRNFLKKINAWLGQGADSVKAVRFFDAVLIVLIVFLLWVPDTKAALGRIIFVDRFYQWDVFVMSPALGYLKGAVLNADIYSPSGVIAPALVGRLAQIFGGFNYEHVLQALIVLSLAYCAIGYGLLRVIFGSVGIAAFGILLFIKLHFFNVSTAPLIWTFPERTVLRFFFDLPVFYFLWRHSQQHRFKDIVLAAAVCGWSIAYMQDTGLYLFLTLGGYLLTVSLFSTAFRFPHDLRKIFLSLLLPWAVAAFVLLIFQRGVFFSAAFWADNAEFMNSFWQGIAVIPVYSALKGRQFFALFMGFAIPVIYVLTVFAVSTAAHFKDRSTKNLWVTAFCFYGLAAHWFYINRSDAAVYYVYAFPLVAVICFWVKALVESLSSPSRRPVSAALAVFAFGALFTNNLFIQYPNGLNISGHAWTEEREFFIQQTNFDKDAMLIVDATESGESAAVISSFTTKMLADASRRPLLYYSPVIHSGLMPAQEFRGTTLFDQHRMEKTLGQLESQKPAVVFVEKKIFMMPIPADYVNVLQSWIQLKDYLTEHYEPKAEGKYLLVLKRKPGA